VKTHFYNRTLYKHLQQDIPHCFISLDERFDKKYSNLGEASSGLLPFAENVCRRMGDIDFYAQSIDDAYSSHDLPFDNALLIGTFLVGYFGTCKSLLDAGAITLSSIFQLELESKHQDLDPKRGRFWGKLNAKNSDAFNRYQTLQPFFKEIIEWRDFSVHRLTPIVVVSGPTNARQGKSPSEINRSDVNIQMVANPDVYPNDLIKEGLGVSWMHPPDLHLVWRPKLVQFCEYLCADIESKL
jgi:hypothetical protein